MPHAISPRELERSLSSYVVVDVRKEPAKRESGMTIAGALPRRPFAAESWWPEFRERSLVVFCVHGHEVSQAVCGFLNDQGMEAVYLEGGFEAWKALGLPTTLLDAAS